MRALLEGVFDYAGMFAPASLPFAEAMRESEEFETTLARPWMVLGQAVLTLDNTLNLDRDTLERHGYSARSPCRVCTVGVPISEADSARKLLTIWERAAQGRAIGISLELHAMPDHFSELDNIPTLDNLVGATLLAVEPRMDAAGWVAHGEFIRTKFISWRNAGLQIALKVRMAGPTALDAQTLAGVIAFCADEHIPLKLTQGLHHPLKGISGAEFGFLSAAFALRLRQAFGAEFSDIQSLLLETNSKNFKFESQKISWMNWHLDVREMDELRQSLPFSVGSCSLAEPDAELTSEFGTI